MIHPRVLPPIVVFFAGAWLLSPAAGAQQRGRGRGGQEQPPPENLRVLPADTPRPQVQQIMQGFTQALGVNCGYCHVPSQNQGRRGGGGRGRGAGLPFDYPSDDKPEKTIAREMMRLVGDINPKIAAATGKPAGDTTRVQCITCHRGVAVPLQLPEILTRTATDEGLDAAQAKYRELRKQYFGAQAYDFSEGALVAFAQQATDADRPDDALAWLNLNLEYHPLSARTYAGISQAQQRKNDREAAVASLEHAIELDPRNDQLKQQLEQLRQQ